MVSTTRLVPGSMRETVLPRKFATQTAPPPVTTPCGPGPTLIGLPTLRFVRGSIRVTVSPSGVRHPHRALADRDAGRLEPVDDGLLDPDACAGSTRTSAAAEAGGGPDRSRAQRDELRRLADLHRPAVDLLRVGVDLDQRPAVVVQDPHAAEPDRDGGWRRADLDLVLDLGPAVAAVRTTTSTTIAATAIAASATGRSGKRLGCGPVDIGRRAA